MSKKETNKAVQTARDKALVKGAKTLLPQTNTGDSVVDGEITAVIEFSKTLSARKINGTVLGNTASNTLQGMLDAVGAEDTELPCALGATNMHSIRTDSGYLSASVDKRAAELIKAFPGLVISDATMDVLIGLKERTVGVGVDKRSFVEYGNTEGNALLNPPKLYDNMAAAVTDGSAIDITSLVNQGENKNPVFIAGFGVQDSLDASRASKRSTFVTLAQTNDKTGEVEFKNIDMDRLRKHLKTEVLTEIDGHAPNYPTTRPISHVMSQAVDLATMKVIGPQREFLDTMENANSAVFKGPKELATVQPNGDIKFGTEDNNIIIPKDDVVKFEVVDGAVDFVVTGSICISTLKGGVKNAAKAKMESVIDSVQSSNGKKGRGNTTEDRGSEMKIHAAFYPLKDTGVSFEEIVNAKSTSFKVSPVNTVLQECFETGRKAGQQAQSTSQDAEQSQDAGGDIPF